MGRPALDLSTLGVARLSILNMIRSGRITVDDGARILGCHRKTVWRLCKRYGIDPIKAHDSYVDRLTWRLQALLAKAR